MKNLEIIGFTKKNLSFVIRIGFADYNDFRNGTNYVCSQIGEIYRPLNYGETFFTHNDLPENAKWVLSKELTLTENSKIIVNTINKEFSTQTGSLDKFIRTYFNYHQLISGTIDIERTGIQFNDGWNFFPYLKFNYCPVCGIKLQ